MNFDTISTNPLEFLSLTGYTLEPVHDLQIQPDIIETFSKKQSYTIANGNSLLPFSPRSHVKWGI